MSHNISYMFYFLDLEISSKTRNLQIFFIFIIIIFFTANMSIHVCMCMHCAGSPLVAHPSVFSTVSTLSVWDWSIQTTTYSDWSGHRWIDCPLSSHTHKWPTHHETQPADDLKEWKLLTPQVVSFLKNPSSRVNLLSACQVSDLHLEKNPVGDWEAEHKFKALFEVAMAITRSTHIKSYIVVTHCCYKEIYTQRRSDSTCGLGDNYRRVTKGWVWKVFEKGVVMQD